MIIRLITPAVPEFISHVVAMKTSKTEKEKGTLIAETKENNNKTKDRIPSNRVNAAFFHDPLLVRAGSDPRRRDPPLLQQKRALASSVCELKG